MENINCLRVSKIDSAQKVFSFRELLHVAKSTVIPLFILSFILFHCSIAKGQMIDNAFLNAQQHCKNMLLVAKNPSTPPRTSRTDGTLALCPNIYDWTSGFFAGNLWYTFEGTMEKLLGMEELNGIIRLSLII